MTYTYRNTETKVEGLTARELVNLLRENHKGYFLKNGCDVWAVANPWAAVEDNKFLDVCSSSHPRISNPVATIRREG